MSSAHYDVRHRVRARFVISTTELDVLDAALLELETTFSASQSAVQVHDVYFGQGPADAVGSLPVLDESARDGLATRLRFRWRGEDVSSALGHLQLESETTGLACQVSQRVDVLLDPTALTVEELRDTVRAHTQGFLRMELIRRQISTLYAGSARTVRRSGCGRIWATIDRELRCTLLEDTATVLGPAVMVDPDRVVVTLHAAQRDIALLLRTAETLPFARSDARSASRARFHLLG